MHQKKVNMGRRKSKLAASNLQPVLESLDKGVSDNFLANKYKVSLKAIRNIRVSRKVDSKGLVTSPNHITSQDHDIDWILNKKNRKNYYVKMTKN